MAGLCYESITSWFGICYIVLCFHHTVWYWLSPFGPIRYAETIGFIASASGDDAFHVRDVPHLIWSLNIAVYAVASFPMSCLKYVYGHVLPSVMR